jgi:hypothetical protein
LSRPLPNTGLGVFGKVVAGENQPERRCTCMACTLPLPEDVVATRTDPISQFLATGHYDPVFRGWPGQNILDSIQRGTEALQTALIAELKRREARILLPSVTAPSGHSLRDLTRNKVTPMVRGLLSRNEWEPMLLLLENCVVFLTPDDIESQIWKTTLGTAWQLANIYLRSIKAEPLSHDFPNVVGYSEETTPYISLAYFVEEEPFADFLVHEVAHVFHNTKRATVGLLKRRHCDWLLPIAFRMRETFAYACESYSRILERKPHLVDRRALLRQLKLKPAPPDDRVEPAEYFDILSDAIERRNGWRAILERCS